MTFSFSNNADDYLGYHMYMASKSSVIVKRKMLARYIFALFYAVFGIYFFWKEEIIFGFSFVLLGILWFVFFPLMNKKSSAKFYRKYINENYRSKFNRTIQLTIEKDFIFVSDGHTESKVPVTEFEKLIETKDTFYLKLRSASSFIIPKTQVDNSAFKSAVSELGIGIVEETTWEWK